MPNGSGTLVYEGLAQTLTNKTIALKQSAAPTPTAEGDIQWDTDDDKIVVGTGSGQALFGQVTPWVAYTPTFTAFGTVASISVFSRRVGDTLEIKGRFQSGTSTATEARVTLGFNGTNGGLTIDAAKNPTIRVAGSGAFSVPVTFQLTLLAESGAAYLTFGGQGGTDAGLTKQNGSAIAASGTTVSFQASVPITGW